MSSLLLRFVTCRSWLPRLGLLAVAAAILSACAAPVSFPAPGPNWQTYTGQMHYRGGQGRSVIGDVVIRRSPSGDFHLAFQSGPGFPLLRISQSGGNARLEGALARGTWRGPVARAPKPLRGWVQLAEAFDGISRRQTTLAGQGWSGRATYAGARPQRINVSSAESGDEFALHLSP